MGRKFPEETLAVFVKPPSIDELKIRLKKRKTESEDKINMRIAKASAELATAPLFDIIIENDDLNITGNAESTFQFLNDDPLINADQPAQEGGRRGTGRSTGTERRCRAARRNP